MLLKETEYLLIEIFDAQNFWFEPVLEELHNGTRRYPRTKNSQNQKEKVICDRLATNVPGSKTEVVTDSGRIDVLTPDRVIEVKQVRVYKHAVGQIISYGYYYPRLIERVYLYGQVSSKWRKLIIQECHTSQI